MAILFFISYPLSWYALQKPSRYPFAHKVRSFFCRLLLNVTFIFPKISGNKNVDWNKSLVITPNHGSMMDFIISVAVIRKYHVYMPKVELGKFPVFGIYFRKMDIPVDRKSKSASSAAFQRALDTLKMGVSVLVYPEGGIPNCTPEIGKFKSGPFRMAVQTKTNVLPILFPDNFRKFQIDGRWSARPGIYRVHILEEVDISGFNEGQQYELQDHVRNTMIKTLKEL